MCPALDSNATSIRDNALIEMIGADGTPIGNVSDRAKVDSYQSIPSIAAPMINRVDINAQVITATGNTSWLDTSGMGCLSFVVNVTAASGVSPTFQVELEISDDQSNVSLIQSLKRIIAIDAVRVPACRIAGKYYRYKWTATGTTPSFTTTITSTLKAYLPKRQVTSLRYGDLAIGTLNSTSTVFNALDCCNVSVIAIRGASGIGSATFQVQASNDNVNWATFTGGIIISTNQVILTNVGTGISYRYFRGICTNISTGANAIDLQWSANGGS